MRVCVNLGVYVGIGEIPQKVLELCKDLVCQKEPVVPCYPSVFGFFFFFLVRVGLVGGGRGRQ